MVYYGNVTDARYYSGGNDIGLLALLNICVFQMGVMSKEQAARAKLVAEVDRDYEWASDFDWDSISRTCEEQIANSRSLAISQTFNNNYDNVLTAAKKKLNNGYVPPKVIPYSLRNS
jgi:hypothetical protein